MERAIVPVAGFQAVVRQTRYIGLVISMQHPRPYSDTDPAAMEVWLNLLRTRPDGERLASLFELIDFAWEMAEIGVRSRFPNASDREVFLRTAALHLSRDEMIRAYQWDPQEA